MGGDRFMGHNQTAAVLDADSLSYCDAYADLEAAFAYALSLEGIGKIIALGSSYSATLAVKLAVNHPELISRVLAFSPASGDSMTGCSVLPLAFQLRQPALFLRPKSEMSFGSVAADLAAFADMGHEIYISSPGAHGSSMLVSERVEGNTSETWKTVLSFINSP
jgi:pimeloyl-ACP methyl ester carboxylesterase